MIFKIRYLYIQNYTVFGVVLQVYLQLILKFIIWLPVTVGTILEMRSYNL